MLHSDARPFKRPMSRAKLLWIIAGLIVVAVAFYGLAFGRLAVNASHSLHSNAFVMVTWPRPLWRGAIAAVELPEILEEKFGGENVYLTKRVAGLPGDALTRSGDDICVGGTCLRGQRDGGKLVAPLTDLDAVPDGTVFLAGETSDSLDSRYGVIGPRPISEIVAVGIAIPFPHWTKLAEWLQ